MDNQVTIRIIREPPPSHPRPKSSQCNRESQNSPRPRTNSITPSLVSSTNTSLAKSESVGKVDVTRLLTLSSPGAQNNSLPSSQTLPKQTKEKVIYIKVAPKNQNGSPKLISQITTRVRPLIIAVDSSPKVHRRLTQPNITPSIEMSPNRTRLLSSAEVRVPTTPVPQPSILMLPEDEITLLQAVKNSTTQWYCPDISPAEVRKRLERQPAGSFIVRRSNRQHNHYHLAVSTEAGEVQWVTLELTPSGYMIKGFNKVRYYPTMSHLIAAHCFQSAPLPCLLRLPNNASSKGSGRLKPLKAGSMGSASPSLRNRLPPPPPLPINGTRSSMGEHSPATRPSRSWTELLGPREISDAWTDRVSVPPVPPHRTPNSSEQTRKHSQRPLYSLLPQGAACQLFYLGGFEVSGEQWAQAVQLCTDHVLGRGRSVVQLTRVNFRVNETGITVTDLERKFFTQRHFPTACILYIGLDPFDRRWKSLELYNEGIIESKIFGFVAISQSNAIAGPQCHLFCEYDLNESANVICDFTNRYLDIVDV